MGWHDDQIASHDMGDRLRALRYGMVDHIFRHARLARREGILSLDICKTFYVLQKCGEHSVYVDLFLLEKQIAIFCLAGGSVNGEEKRGKFDAAEIDILMVGALLLGVELLRCLTWEEGKFPKWGMMTMMMMKRRLVLMRGGWKWCCHLFGEAGCGSIVRLHWEMDRIEDGKMWRAGAMCGG
jgi:hypothetical protein